MAKKKYMLNIIISFVDRTQGGSQNEIAKYVISRNMKILYSNVHSDGPLITVDLIVKTHWFYELRVFQDQYYNMIRHGFNIDIRSLQINKI